MANIDRLALLDLPDADSDTQPRQIHLAEVAPGKWSVVAHGLDQLAIPTTLRIIAAHTERILVEGS